mmetsp:Transcript_60403/g.145222  ORF Transcript_60403/g.145222 Transcript_60403/m.145222 type:complete len:349 (+) Transcript_60403:324-1370(+)
MPAALPAVGGAAAVRAAVLLLRGLLGPNILVAGRSRPARRHARQRDGREVRALAARWSGGRRAEVGARRRFRRNCRRRLGCLGRQHRLLRQRRRPREQRGQQLGIDARRLEPRWRGGRLLPRGAGGRRRPRRIRGPRAPRGRRLRRGRAPRALVRRRDARRHVAHRRRARGAHGHGERHRAAARGALGGADGRVVVLGGDHDAAPPVRLREEAHLRHMPERVEPLQVELLACRLRTPQLIDLRLERGELVVEQQRVLHLVALAELARRIEAARAARRPLEAPLDADEHAGVRGEEDLVLEGEALGLLGREEGVVRGLPEQVERVDAAEAVRVQLLHEGGELVVLEEER